MVHLQELLLTNVTQYELQYVSPKSGLDRRILRLQRLQISFRRFMVSIQYCSMFDSTLRIARPLRNLAQQWVKLSERLLYISPDNLSASTPARFC